MWEERGAPLSLGEASWGGAGGRGQPTNTHDSSKIQLDTIFKDISKRQRGFKNASLSDARNSQMYFETSYLIHSPLDPALR